MVQPGKQEGLRQEKAWSSVLSNAVKKTLHAIPVHTRQLPSILRTTFHYRYINYQQLYVRFTSQSV